MAGAIWSPAVDSIVVLSKVNVDELVKVMAFPKNGEGKDLMMDSPSEIPDKQMKELGIKLVK